ncbi:MAG: hypothetical protein WD068_01105 [Candidatus Babeliales bacterium]
MKNFFQKYMNTIMVPMFLGVVLVVPLCITSRNNRNLDNGNYGTHMAPLLTVVAHTVGPILELGAGDYSTTLLHAVCQSSQRYILTADTSKQWLDLFLDLKTDWHSFQYVPVYEDDWEINPQPSLWDSVGADREWSVAFIDHRPGERRIDDIQRLRNQTAVFVVHDTQQPSYGWEPLLSSFNYRYVYNRYATQTTIVSDTIDIRDWFSGNQ